MASFKAAEKLGTNPEEKFCFVFKGNPSGANCNPAPLASEIIPSLEAPLPKEMYFPPSYPRLREPSSSK